MALHLHNMYMGTSKRARQFDWSVVVTWIADTVLIGSGTVVPDMSDSDVIQFLSKTIACSLHLC